MSFSEFVFVFVWIHICLCLNSYLSLSEFVFVFVWMCICVFDLTQPLTSRENPPSRCRWYLLTRVTFFTQAPLAARCTLVTLTPHKQISDLMSSAFWYQVKLKICKNRRSFEDFATGEKTGQCCSTNFFNPQASRLVWAVRFFSLLISFFLLIQELLVEHWYSRWWWRHSSRQVMAPAPENQRKCPWQETFSSFNSFPWKSDVRDLNSVEPLLLLPSRTAIKIKVSKLNDISGYSDWVCKQSTKKDKRTLTRCVGRFFLL